MNTEQTSKNIFMYHNHYYYKTFLEKCLYQFTKKKNDNRVH